MAIWSRKAAQPSPVAGARKTLPAANNNPAWASDRPLPVPSSDWVDSDVSRMSPASFDGRSGMRVGPDAQGGESGTNMRKLVG